MDQLQQRFFQEIRKVLPGHLSMADEVAGLLNISTDSAYRRIRNEKSIPLEEMKILASHFKISIDHLLNLENGTGSFKGGYITPGEFDFSAYLQQSYKVLENVASFKEKELIYYCKDIPLFYYYGFPELAAFKYFIWMKTSLNFPEFNNKPFSFEYYMKPFIELGNKVFRLYISIPGTEIMNVENIITTLLQIEFYKNSFMFTKGDTVSILLDKLDELVTHICRQAEEGVKFMPLAGPGSQSSRYSLYVNDFVIGDNTVMAITDDNKTSFITHSHMNFMIINDKTFTDYHHTFIKNIIRKSTLISETGEEARGRFFHLIRQKIELCRQNKLETLG